MPRIDDVDVFVAGLKLRPETVRTFCGDDYGMNTDTNITRRRIRILCDENRVCFYLFDGTLSSVKVYFHPEKDYVIIVRRSRSGFSYHYAFSTHETLDGLSCEKLWSLEEKEWKDDGHVVIPYNEVWRCF